jgi:hypothetical protein
MIGGRVELFLGLLLMGLASLIWCWPRRTLRETTLGGPWLWSWLGVMAVLLCETLVALGGDASRVWSQPLRFAATSGLFCGTISLLGAKRPQDGAWNFIVLTLWGVLALPALEVAFLGRGEDLQLQDVRAWFLWILIGLEFSQRLGTYHWPASALMAGGQGILLARYLPLIRWELPDPMRWVGAIMALLSMLILLRPLPRRSASFDRVWLDFRDQFGVAWSLRVMERINSAADRYRWPFRLHWPGFAAIPPDPLAPPTPHPPPTGISPPPSTNSDPQNSDPQGVFGPDTDTHFRPDETPPESTPAVSNSDPQGVFGPDADTHFRPDETPPESTPAVSSSEPQGVFGSEADTYSSRACTPLESRSPVSQSDRTGVFGSDSQPNSSCGGYVLPTHGPGNSGRSNLGIDAATSMRADEARALERTMSNLLRRFVSDRWIAERLGSPPSIEQPNSGEN